MTPEDWARLDAMTDEEIKAAALSDPDAQPISLERLAAAPTQSRAKAVRQRLHMGRETFASRYGIPLDTLTAWERHKAEPTPAEVAYLNLIAREPEIAKVIVMHPVPEAAK